MTALNQLQEGLEQPAADLIRTIVVIAVAREIPLCDVVHHNAGFVTHGLDLGVLNGAQRVHHMREARNTGSKSAAHISINQRHLGRFIIILIVHILNQIQRIHIQTRQPVHHSHVLRKHFIVAQIFRGNGRISRANLLTALHIHAAIDGVQQTLRQIGAGTEELHFLTRLRSGHAAADRVIVAPDRLHHVIVFILHRAGTDGNLRRVLLESLRQLAGIQYRQVGFRRRAHVFQRAQEAIVSLRHHGATVHANTAHLQRSPHGITAEQLIIGRNTGELHHAELHNHMVNQLLRLGLGNHTVLQIALHVNIKEGRNTANAHGRAILGLDRRQIAEVQPLHRLMRVLRGLRNVIAVNSRHLLHVL